MKYMLHQVKQVKNTETSSGDQFEVGIQRRSPDTAQPNHQQLSSHVVSPGSSGGQV